MQKWDYLIAIQTRGFKDRPDDKVRHEPMDWNISITEKGQKEKEWKGEFSDLLVKLGDEGWELVAVVAVSSLMGGAHSIDGTIDTPPFGTTKGTIYGITTDFAGFTNRKEWVFKRPR